MQDFIRAALAAVQKQAHKAEKPLHMSYFVLVAWEAHSFYGMVAGVCAVVLAVTLGEAPHA